MGPSQSESDVNGAPQRSAWQAAHPDPASRALLARDNAAFLHQSVATPCLAPIAKAQGGGVLTLTPPLIVSQDQMDQALGSLEACLAEESLP